MVDLMRNVGVLGFIFFVLGIVIVALGLLYIVVLVLKNIKNLLIGKKEPFSYEERRTVWRVFLFLLVCELSATISWLCIWAIKLRSEKTFICQNADIARVIYETRTILGYAEAITVASITIFLPLLVLLWNSAKKTISETLYKLLGLRNKSGIDQVELENSINLMHKNLKEMLEIGEQLRRPFYITIVITWCVLLSLVYANFMSADTFISYLLVVILKAASILLLLWFIKLLCLYQILIQPLVREFKHLYLFGLENL